jgi:putative ABC transport system permease protein
MMFWRILWKLLGASRGRLAVALLALASGAAVCSALLNLQLDAERKLTREFRALGANVVVSPPRAAGAAEAEPALLDQSVMDPVAATRTARVIAAAPYLYIVAAAPAASGEQSVIVAGTWLDEVRRMASWWKVDGQWVETRGDVARCLVGRNAARLLGITAGSRLELRSAGRSAALTVAGVATAGDAEDNQVFVNLPVAQHLAGLPGRVGLVQLSVTGSPIEIEAFAGRLAVALPGLEVRPIRQIAEAEGHLLGRIRLLILSTVVLILALTALCVLATMAALAMERRHDVGLMKALGGSMSRIVRLFLAEAGSLGVLGGGIGYAVGVLLSRWIGRSAFGVALSPRVELLPLIVALTVAVALAGALPLRLLGRVRPAAILRDE